MRDDLERIIAGVTPEVDWAICVRRDDAVIAAVDPDRVLPTASIGKVLLLLAVARRLEEGVLRADVRLAPKPDDVVADSGLWQHLAEPELAVESLAVLVASVSDNQAANVLLREVGRDAVDDIARDCGLAVTRLLDRIRDARGPADPPAPSVGSATELAGLMAAIAAGRAGGPGASARVDRWLSLGVDASMVVGGLGVDPLAHVDGPVRLLHKTGWDVGVRADVGHVRGPRSAVSYAVLSRWDPMSFDPSRQVLDTMRAIGGVIGEAVR